MHSLKALVLSDNALTSLPTAFPHLPELNTLVLSHNQLASLPKALPASLPSLKKLSVSHNQLGRDSAAALPDFTVCKHLREVRLNGNADLDRLPANLAQWGCGTDSTAPGLVLLDLGGCALTSFEDIAPLLQRKKSQGRKGLAIVSLKGCAVSSVPGYKDKVSRSNAAA